MDDMLLFHRNKKELHKIKDKIEQFLKNEELLKCFLMFQYRILNFTRRAER